jgi:protein-tyrosine phosphatase
VIDIHCHILPAMDDGPERLETSLAMAAIAAEDGIRTVIATPHADGIRVTPDKVRERVYTLNSALHQHGVTLNILPGYEIPFHLISELAPTHTLAQSNYVLIEFPHMYVPGDALVTVVQLITLGFIPIIAHPERNREVLHNPDLMDSLVEAGAHLQLTASSITGDLGPDVQSSAHYLLRKNLVHFIATDSHSPSFRAPVLQKAHSTAVRLLGRSKADLLTTGNPQKILAARNRPVLS